MKNFTQLYQLLKTYDKREIGAFEAYLKDTRKEHERIFEMVQEIVGQAAMDLDSITTTYADLLKSNPSQYYGDIYDSALKALSALLNRGISPMMEFELRANILFQKRLYDHVVRQIMKAANLAEEEEYYKEGSRLVLMLEQLVDAGTISRSLVPDYFDCVEVERVFKIKEKNLDEYLELYREVRKASKLPPEQMLEQFAEIKNSDLLNSTDHCKCKRAEILFHRIFYAIAFFTQDYLAAIDPLLNIKAVFDSKPTLKRDAGSLSYYLATEMLLGIAYQITKSYDKAWECVHTLEKLAHPNAPNGKEAYERLALLRLNLAIYTFDESIVDFIKDIDGRLHADLKNISSDNSVAIIYQLAQYFLYADNPEMALSCLNPIWITQNCTFRPRQQKVCLLLFLAGHFQKGNYDVVLQQINGIKKRMVELGGVGKFESFVLGQLSRLSTCSPNELKAELEISKQQFRIFFSQSENKMTENNFDWINWLEGLILNVTTFTVLKGI